MRLAWPVVLLALLPVAARPQSSSFLAESRTFFTTADGLPSDDVRQVWILNGVVHAATSSGAACFRENRWQPIQAEVPSNPHLTATDGRGATAEARRDGLYRNGMRLYPRTAARSWAPDDVRAVAYDSRGRLWFASPQGAGCRDGETWTLYTGADGLPYDDFTTIAAGENGVVWFGTTRGAIRFDGRNWEYRQGPRWLPHDHVRSIAVDQRGNAWISTPRGVARIERTPLTLAEKARRFEAAIDLRHRRTPFEYVHPVVLKQPGDLSQWTQTDSDNDGLWTSMYGAGECYACAATRSEAACARARKAFEGLQFLGTVTQGGAHPAPPGFLARSILPTSGPDPNRADSAERDRERRQQRDRLWKILTPRWPVSADGQWYWKTDTSSDELDGHYFFYGLYYDLVANTDAEKARVRRHVAAVTDHLLSHNYRFVDHDGRPTRWGIFNPEDLNFNHDWWQERGMNSLSMLCYLRIAHHITGDSRYDAAIRTLVGQHGYGMNSMIVKTHLGFGAGNQSDDEMIFMNFYGLLRYETDPELRKKLLLSFHHHWQNEIPERNPVFHFLYAAVAKGQSYEDAFGKVDLSPSGDWLEDSVDTLRRLPLDRVDWRLTNSHRKDILRLPEHVRGPGGGYRVDGKVLPIDERWVGHWNHDPWQLDQGGGGRTLGDGAVFLLPYYMGLYHGFLRE